MPSSSPVQAAATSTGATHAGAKLAGSAGVHETGPASCTLPSKNPPPSVGPIGKELVPPSALPASSPKLEPLRSAPAAAPEHAATRSSQKAWAVVRRRTEAITSLYRLCY